MVKITWHYGEPPKDMQIRQVYAIAFDEHQRVLLKEDHFVDKVVYGMFGGTPENFDTNILETLKREFLEEANNTLKEPIYLVGYQEIEGDKNLPNYAQLRMVAMIDKVGEKLPDIDNGKTYERLLTTPQNAIKILNWGDSGEKQITKAYEIAKEKFAFKTQKNEDKYI